VAEYDKLGHGEVVSMNIPSDKVGDFAQEYFKLFGPDSERPDKVKYITLHAYSLIILL
jgi:hypothetical protein